MSTDKESLQQRASQIEQEKEELRVFKLSNKSMPLAIVISFLLPIGGYIYTGRWKAFFILFGSAFLVNCLIILGSNNEKDGFQNAITFSSILGTIIAPIDNGLAINRAKEKLKKQS